MTSIDFHVLRILHIGLSVKSMGKVKDRESYSAEVVDLFCGVGALSYGLKLAGLKVIAGYDIDARCKYAFETNNDAEFIHSNVAELNGNQIRRHFSGNSPSVLAGCAPCQPFSSYKHRYAEDPKWNLVTKFSELVVDVKPDFVTMENVPSLIKYRGGSVFNDFCNTLEQAGYKVEFSIAKCEQFGVPQKRRRLVLLASNKYSLQSIKPTHKIYRTVRDAIYNLPKIEAGERNQDDPLHASASLSELNTKRIKASVPGGTWRDWPEELIADCHKKQSGKTYPGVYARMTWDEPSPTMTTQCFGFGNGRFGHPEQNRAISLREAAMLQSFPENYKFVPKHETPSIKELGKWIGNAVPVKLAEAIGLAISQSCAG